ncbi:cytochrome c biogenesis protein ResB [Desulfitobacterium sp. Sab5]|uniref:cytochrome c biogenesis protein ResB n=1 Tax=Desulfitobacterium nosdiversum TaxID=3375356 RepID=UPI003CEEE1A3
MEKPVKRIWNFIISMKVGVFLLILFAVFSVVGTVIPQESFAPDKVEALNPVWQRLGITHLYSSFFYRLLVFALCLNLASCTIHRFPKALKVFKQVPLYKTAAQIEELPVHHKMTDMQQSHFQKNLEAALKAKHFQYQLQPEEETLNGWAQKGRIGVWGSFIVHLSFLILILGTVIGHVSGFKGFFGTYEGATFPLNQIKMEEGKIQEDWTLRINSATEKFDSQGLRENWYTDLSILQNGKEVKRQVLSVNHPLVYKGVTFYQSSYGQGALFFTTAQGKKVNFALQEHAQNYFQLPGTELYVIADSITVSSGRISVNYQILGKESPTPLQAGALNQGEKATIPNFGDIVLTGPVQFTELVIKKDPGVPLIWLGSALLVFGLILAFYFKSCHIWFVIEGEGQSRIVLGATSAAGLEGAQELLDDLVQDIQKGPKRKIIHGLEEDWQN